MQEGETMNYGEFVQTIVKHFEEQLGDQYTICINQVMKNNNVQLDGLMMKKEGQKVTPNIHLNGFYEQYIEKDNLEQVLQNIWGTYQEAMNNFDTEVFDFSLSWELKKDSLVYRVVNYKENRHKLSVLPHFRFLDLAITFHCVIQQQEDTLSTLPVTNQIMDYWKKDLKSLLEYATKNTPKLFPMTEHTMREVIGLMVGSEMFQTMDSPSEEDVKMYVISNSQGINGATVILYQEEFQKVAKKLGGKIYILPSSIHELVLIPYDGFIDVKMLVELVNEVNNAYIPMEDLLSNHIYLYDSEKMAFEIF